MVRASTLCRPIDFLGIDNDRLTIMCVFGAATGSILNLVLNNGIAEGRNAWEIGMNAFLTFDTYIAVAYPDILPKGTLLKRTSPKRTSPNGIVPNGHFADAHFVEWSFRRKDILPNRQFAENRDVISSKY